MGTTVEYNGVTLKNVLTLEFDQTTRRDSSGTDKLFSDTTIRVLATINLQALAVGKSSASIGVFGQNGQAMGDVLKGVLCLLGHDRKNFKYSIGGVTVYERNVDKSGPDYDLGPKVLECRAVQITSQTVQLVFGIKIAVLCCDSAVGNQILNNRWCVIDDLDDNFKTTRTFRGLLRLNTTTDIKNQLNPQAFREFCFPPLCSGFKRKKMNFAGSMNGLEMAYEITDEEMIGQAPPFPATKMHAIHSETVGLDPSFSIGDAYVRLDGPKGADKRVMIERAMQIIQQKFLLARPNANALVQMVQIIDHISEDENCIEAKAQVHHTLPQAQGSEKVDIGSLVMREIGKPLNLPNYDDQKALLLGPYGTASFATLLACFLQDLCKPPAAYSNAQDTGTKKSEKKTKEDKRDEPAEVNFHSTGYSNAAWGKIDYNPDQTQAIYTFAEVDTITSKKSMKIGLPVALDDKGEKNGDDSTRMIRLGSPISRLTIRIALERQGTWPKILKDKDFSDNNKIKYTLLRSIYNGATPKLTQDGKNKFHSISAEFEYAMSRALKEGESFTATSLPWDNTPSKDNKIQASAFIEPTDKKGIA